MINDKQGMGFNPSSHSGAFGCEEGSIEHIKEESERAGRKACIENLYPVVEIFHSIEGEGIRTGLPVTFVRFEGCNLRCSYCDTKYSYEPELILTSVESPPQYSPPSKLLVTKSMLAKRIMQQPGKRVTFTGGEPLLYKEFILWFANRYPEYKINVETNGSLSVDRLIELPNVIITADYKCPSSGMNKFMNLNYNDLRKTDVVKFVVGNDNDLRCVEDIITNKYNLQCLKYISPIFGKIPLDKLADFVKDNPQLGLRMGLQIHKFIWDPNKRGV